MGRRRLEALREAERNVTPGPVQLLGRDVLVAHAGDLLEEHGHRVVGGGGVDGRLGHEGPWRASHREARAGAVGVALLLPQAGVQAAGEGAPQHRVEHGEGEVVLRGACHRHPPHPDLGLGRTGAIEQDDSRTGGGRRGGCRGRRGLASLPAAEAGLQQRKEGVGLHVARHQQRGVARVVVAPVERHHVVPVQGSQGGPGAQEGRSQGWSSPYRARVKALLASTRGSSWSWTTRVTRSSRTRSSSEAGKVWGGDHVGQEVQGGLQAVAEHRELHLAGVGPGGGEERGTQPFQLGGDVEGGAARRSLFEHVGGEARQPRAPGGHRRCPAREEELEAYQGQLVALHQRHGEAVGEVEALHPGKGQCRRHPHRGRVGAVGGCRLLPVPGRRRSAPGSLARHGRPSAASSGRPRGTTLSVTREGSTNQRRAASRRSSRSTAR